MILVKHATLGNKHVPEGEVPGLLKEGWVKWPRSKEEKNAVPLSPQIPVSPKDGAGAAPTVSGLRAALQSKGIDYDNRWGLKKLQEALDAHST